MRCKMPSTLAKCIEKKSILHTVCVYRFLSLSVGFLFIIIYNLFVLFEDHAPGQEFRSAVHSSFSGHRRVSMDRLSWAGGLG